MPDKTHIVSYRIGDAGNADARQSSLLETACHLSEDGVWEETTSLILLKSDKSARQIATDLYMRSAMRHDLDTLLVIDLDTKTYSTQGKVEYPNTLDSYFD